LREAKAATDATDPISTAVALSDRPAQAPNQTNPPASSADLLS
jgi:hypothetical protein